MPENLFGWIDPEQQLDVDALRKKINPKHPYTVIVDDNHYLVHTADNLYQDTRFSIVYRGQMRWNSHALQTIANEQGNGFAIKSAFETQGRHFLTGLLGDFSLAILEPKTGYALLAIDRLGIRRLVYNAQDGLIFSNCLKTLNHYSGRQPEISMQAVYNYIYFHMVPSPDSIYEDIQKLQPGHCIEYRNGITNNHRYWSPDFRRNTPLTTAEQNTKLHDTLSKATTRHTGKDVGAFLSGGLDSSTVSGFLSRAQPHAKTFSIGFDADGYDETEYARIAAEHFGTNHHEYYVTPKDVLDIVPKIAHAYDEPFGNSSAIPVYYCAKLAKEMGCSTLLAGDGGDELFGGNERYVKQKLFETYRQSPEWIQQLNRRFFDSRLGKIVGPRKANSFIRQAHTPLPERMENYNFLHQIAPSEVFSQPLLESVNTEQPIEHLRNRFLEPDQADYLDRMLYLDWKRTLADNDLRKVNEMCALAGIEVHYPMLDDELVDFSCSIPSRLKIKGMKIRHFYKQGMKGFLPDQILGKSKHGFGLPFGVWMKTHPELQDMAYDAIAQLKQRHYFKPAFLDNAVAMHSGGHASYYGELIWILMMLSLWCEKHVQP